jgi:uncharacterized membrane protein YhaH (DUF805 family)
MIPRGFKDEGRMDWKYLFTSFEGRISRKPFWFGLLVLIAAQWSVGILLFTAVSLSLMHGADPVMSPRDMFLLKILGVLLPLAVALVFLYPSVAIYSKRWHDRGKSGWWMLILFIPLLGFIWFLIECGFLPGTEGPNQYGKDPLA